tara:strand:- start:303 stop:539 length:237 start_codon:yes stop_codon:yes gene_type:complete
MQAIIYSNRSQECERARMLLESVHEDIREFYLDDDFTKTQFQAEFGGDAEYPQIAIGLNHRGNLKETLQYMKDHDMIH